jgi:phosphoribosylpyrophosphate synthetase
MIREHKVACGAKIVSDYLHSVYNPKEFVKTVNKTTLLVKKLYKQYKAEGIIIDSIAVRGTSGASVGFAVSYKTGLPVTMIRKESEDSHCYLAVEGYTNPKNYIIIDDLICSGSTVKEIIEKIDGHNIDSRKKPVCKHIVLYASFGEPNRRIGKRSIPVSGLIAEKPATPKKKKRK